LGLVDDLKISIAPKFRLFIMITFLMILVIFNEIYIKKTGLEFLDNLVEIDIFSLMFICLCFLFIINGSNLVDGFNGLLGIHSLIIFMILLVINLINENNNLIYILFYVSLSILIFLKFNFPKAQVFLGDGGSYLVGTLIAISIIKTSFLEPSISPFFFCILLFYLFFEVFFSFFRKLFVARQSPLLPDKQHLHMLLYKLLFKKNKKKFNSNYTVSIYINLIYLTLIIPGIIFMDNGLFCRYYFFSLLIVYIYFYKILNEKIK
jgi:UDP-N-acetylmuramyl pentapeptide phosphotransferase/UDP-N-acetylglucosamine-1-phosphate transferase